MNVISYNALNKQYWPVVLLLATGVLSGCHYCEPVLLATLVSGGVFRLLNTRPHINTGFNQLHH